MVGIIGVLSATSVVGYNMFKKQAKTSVGVNMVLSVNRFIITSLSINKKVEKVKFNEIKVDNIGLQIECLTFNTNTTTNADKIKADDSSWCIAGKKDSATGCTQISKADYNFCIDSENDIHMGSDATCASTQCTGGKYLKR